MSACVVWMVQPGWDGHGTEEVQCNAPAVAIVDGVGSVCAECLPECREHLGADAVTMIEAEAST